MRPSVLLVLYTFSVHSVVGKFWCTFHGNADCTGGKSVAFSVTNDGCFKSVGKSMTCSGIGDFYYKLVQSPNNNMNCNCQYNCASFAAVNMYDQCVRMDAKGFNPNFHTYRFVAGPPTSYTCGANNCKRRSLSEQQFEDWEGHTDQKGNWTLPVDSYYTGIDSNCNVYESDYLVGSRTSDPNLNFA